MVFNSASVRPKSILKPHLVSCHRLYSLPSSTQSESPILRTSIRG